MGPVFPSLNVPRAVFGAGSLSSLAMEVRELGLSRLLLVTDKGVVAAGLAERVHDVVRGVAMLTNFDRVTENPLFADVEAGTALYRSGSCDGVIALGGGSVIDAAKFIALLATNAGAVADYAGVPGVRHAASAPLIAIPTTAGTGSEASHSAGIHPNPTTATVGMSSRHLVPRVAILDPDLTASLPARLAAATGIDALSHCIEGYLSERDIPLGKTIALDGVRRAARALRQAVMDRDAAARADMMLAAFAGGIAIGMGLGPGHAVAITCSDQGFPHGVLSGIGLITTLDATAAHVPERVAAVATALGVEAPLSMAITSLMRDLGLPTSLLELGYTVTNVAGMGQTAHRSHFNTFAPHHPSAEEYAALITASAGR